MALAAADELVSWNPESGTICGDCGRDWRQRTAACAAARTVAARQEISRAVQILRESLFDKAHIEGGGMREGRGTIGKVHEGDIRGDPFTVCVCWSHKTSSRPLPQMSPLTRRLHLCRGQRPSTCCSSLFPPCWPAVPWQYPTHQLPRFGTRDTTVSHHSPRASHHPQCDKINPQHPFAISPLSTAHIASTSVAAAPHSAPLASVVHLRIPRLPQAA
jgi:hypothetical protein